MVPIARRSNDRAFLSEQLDEAVQQLVEAAPPGDTFVAHVNPLIVRGLPIEPGKPIPEASPRLRLTLERHDGQWHYRGGLVCLNPLLDGAERVDEMLLDTSEGHARLQRTIAARMEKERPRLGGRVSKVAVLGRWPDADRAAVVVAVDVTLAEPIAAA